MNGRVLLLGIGNPGRHDDGLGPALAAAVEALALPGVDTDADYQLTVEDAVAVAAHRVVVFADADAAGPAPFGLRPLAPGGGVGFSSHGIEPGGVLGLARDLFGAAPEAYLLGIRGYEFGERGEGRIELGEGLTPGARENLAAALEFLVPRLRVWAG